MIILKYETRSLRAAFLTNEPITPPSSLPSPLRRAGRVPFIMDACRTRESLSTRSRHLAGWDLPLSTSCLPDPVDCWYWWRPRSTLDRPLPHPLDLHTPCDHCLLRAASGSPYRSDPLEMRHRNSYSAPAATALATSKSAFSSATSALSSVP